MFAGARARSADLAALQKAQRLSGSDPRRVWQETGWFEGLDGHWRWEIDDSRAHMVACSRWDRAPRVLAHEDLYDAYDGARRAVIHVRLAPGFEPASGHYRPGMPRTDLHCAKETEITLLGPSAAELRAAALHELQHAVQDFEGFAPGASRAAHRWLRYVHSLGEAEARAVEARRDMTPGERRALFPLDSYDVPIATLRRAAATLGAASLAPTLADE
jgi:hypothetical protein